MAAGSAEVWAMIDLEKLTKQELAETIQLAALSMKWIVESEEEKQRHLAGLEGIEGALVNFSDELKQARAVYDVIKEF